MTSKELYEIIDGEAMARSACSNTSLTAEDIKNLAIKYSREDLAAKIDINGSSWAANCVIKEATE